MVIASMSGHRLPALTVEQNEALATTPVEELLALRFYEPDRVAGHRCMPIQISERRNSLRVMAEAVQVGQTRCTGRHDQPRHDLTPLAKDELTGPRGEGYRRMIASFVRPGAPAPRTKSAPSGPYSWVLTERFHYWKRLS